MDTAGYLEKITTLFGRVSARTEPDPEAEAEGLTPSLLHGMSYLYHHGRSSVGDIAGGLGITHPACVKLVDRLQRKGLVKRMRNKADRRISLIALTGDGRLIAARALSKRTEVLERALARMERSRIEDLMRGLEALLAATLENPETVESLCLRCGDEHIGCCVINRAHLELTGSNMQRY